MKITKTYLLFFSLSLTLLSGSVFAEEALTRSIVFNNQNINAAPITHSSTGDIDEWGSYFTENQKPTNNTIGTNNCHSSRSIVMFGNNTTGSAIAHSQTKIDQCSH